MLGCRSDDDETGYKGETVKPITSGPNASAAGGATYAAPPANVPAGTGYAVAPPDPNDPRFKADPKLAGSGSR